MSIKGTAIKIAAALTVASAPSITYAQAAPQSARKLSPELEALNPPVPADLVLSADRQVPAEKKAAAYKDPKWKAPRTSWGHPNISGTWSTDDMRGIPSDRPEALGAQEFVSDEQYIERAKKQQAGTEHAAHVQTFHRVAYGARTFGFSSLVVDPPNGRKPALTADGKARAEAVAKQGSFSNGPFDKFEDFNLYDRCISRGIPAGMGAVLYGNGVLITQSPDTVTITYEMVHETRAVHLDSRPPLPGEIMQYNGNSRGHWDGDTLVIESTGFRDNTEIGGAPNTTSLKTTERIRRIDPEMVEYRVTIDDPKTYTAPFTVRTVWTTQSDYQEIYEYSCHEGNYAVGGGLAGERTYDREVEEAKAKGLPIPARSSMEIYAEPDENAEVFNVNKGQ